MARQVRQSFLALFIVAFALPTFAQTPAKPKRTPRTATADADPLVEVRRNAAITLVTSLADEARNFRDQTLRARVQARAADALWETDAERARALFRRAWEAAEAADVENARRTEDERRAIQASRGSSASRSLPSARPEVLRLAARRDRQLGEEFLAKMEEARKQEASATNQPAATPAVFNPDEPPANVEQRMSLARQLLEEGNVESAMQIGDTGLYPVNVFGMNFLDKLREKNAAAADQRYTALLSRVALDPASDANTVSLLSSYVFTPYLYLTFSRNGGGHTRRWRDDNSPPADLPAQLRAAFLQTAATVLLRPTPPPEQDKTSAGRKGKHSVIARLAPLFEQHAPDKAPALRAQLAALQPDAREDDRHVDESALTRGLVPEDPNRDRVQESLDRLNRAKTAEERDQIYVQAAMAAAEQKDARAREFVDKIEDLDVRRQMRAFMDFRAVSSAIRDKNAEDALRFARSGELSSVQRTWGMTEAARLLGKAEAGRAIEILEEATTEARRIDPASPDRTRALLSIVTQLFELDRARAWDAMAEVVKSANAVSAFTGEDGGLTVRVKFKEGAMTMNFNIESFDLGGIFTALARDDFNRAVELARSFTAESPRATATLAVARTVLDKKR
ncbi:MAG TPA: hypothetical protein VGB73_15715 [Pyrinomonadaceae bacterium]|jgi:hypothetical protein